MRLVVVAGLLSVSLTACQTTAPGGSIPDHTQFAPLTAEEIEGIECPEALDASTCSCVKEKLPEAYASVELSVVLTNLTGAQREAAVKQTKVMALSEALPAAEKMCTSQ